MKQEPHTKQLKASTPDSIITIGCIFITFFFFIIDRYKTQCYTNVTISNTGDIMDFIILGLLILSNRTIYQLRNRIDKGLNYMYSSSTGSIQAAIKKLLNKGYIDFREITENGKNKKEYFITESGKEAFNNWINSPVNSFDFKCPDLSKIYFMGFTQQQKRADNILQYISELNTKHNALKLICNESKSYMQSEEYKHLDKSVKDIIFYQLSTARYGSDLLAFTIKWYENFLEEMRSNDD